MVRSLLEIKNPWLTRDQMEAAIWRLTETKSAAAVEQLLRLSDIYAASQGPALAQRLRERDQIQSRWRTELPDLAGRQVLKLAEPAAEEGSEPGPPDQELAAEAAEPSPVPAEHSPSEPVLITEGRPIKAADAWRLPDGGLIQLCTGCDTPKAYDEFYGDKHRWNGRASQCKQCRNKKNTYQRRQHKNAEDNDDSPAWLAMISRM